MADLSYLEQLANISQLSDAELTSLQKTIITSFGEAEDNDDLDAMAAAADALDQVREAQALLNGTQTNNTTNIGAPDSSPVDTADVANSAIAASADGGDDGGAPVITEVGSPIPSADTTPSTPPESAESAESESAEPSDEGGEETDETADGDGEAEPADAEQDTDTESDDPDEVDDEDAVTAAGKLPAALKAHEFKKGGKAAPAEGSAAEEADETPDDEEKEDAVTAASSTKESGMAVEQEDLPVERQPLVASSTTSIVAGADIPGRAAGSEFDTYRDVNEAFVSRLGTLRNARGGDGDKLIVASVQSTVDPDRELRTGDDAANFDKIEAVTRAMSDVGREALVASGGYCAPLEVRYDIFGVGVTDRPIRDSLAGFQATRGGIRYVQPPILSSFSGAVGLWTAANDASPSSPATKPFLTAACQSEVTVTADAVTLEIQFGNLMTRAYPELVARNNELGLIYHARFAEETLLTKISAASTAVTATWQLGTAIDFLNSVGRLASGYRHRHRLAVDTPLRVLAPSWQLDAMREDLTRGHPSSDPIEGIQWADSVINGAMDNRHINITWFIDDSAYTGVQNAGAINDFPAAIVYYLFAEGTFLFLDGGTLDLGIVRDSTLVGTNDYRMFVETFEGLAKVGIESIKATVTTHITGASVGTIDPT